MVQVGRGAARPAQSLEGAYQHRSLMVEEVQLRVVQIVRQFDESGQVTVVRGYTNDVFV